MKIRKRLVLCTMSLVLFIAAGCTEEKKKIESDIVKEGAESIQLESIDSYFSSGDKPFTVQTIEDKDEVEQFIQAINQAQERLGMLDYSPMFEMNITYSDGTSELYHLNVGNGEVARGLLVRLGEQYAAYEIPEDAYAELARLIYYEKE